MQTETYTTNLEPTLYDVLEAVNIGFKRFDGLEARFDGFEIRFEGLETRFDGLETRFDGLEAKMDAGFTRVGVEIHELGQRVVSLETRVTTLALKVDGVDERLVALSEAFDRDTVKLINHEKRIKKLEGVRFAI